VLGVRPDRLHDLIERRPMDQDLCRLSERARYVVFKHVPILPQRLTSVRNPLVRLQIGRQHHRHTRPMREYSLH
jgi:hypothetical protein